ncbi:hypothetical protein [Paenibacillus campi]|uniref:hypothetical protein n=1 Tax=Paenibacillus campi TaxID=3106031 RepID=UPI002AFDEBE8|nr:MULTISPECIES: hypothetical protein [unclassified Paenibacillus]
MNLTNEQVIHETFGVGQVVENDDERITVMFAQNVGRKSFVFPDVFSSHLKMRKPDIQETLNQAYEMKQKQQAAQLVVEKREAEEEAVRLAEEQAQAKKATRKKATKKSS